MSVKKYSLIILSCISGLNFAINTHAAEAPDDLNEEVITLDEFRVSTARDDDSWLVTESTSATRMAMPVIDMPYSISVLTEDFIDGFGLYDVNEQAVFIAGMSEGDKNTGADGPRIRGFGGLSFRNGFFRTQQPEANSIRRIEVVRGPQSAIYGRSAPGGIINYISKKPSKIFTSGISHTFGSFDLSRTTGYVSGPVVKNRLHYRLDMLYNYNERPTDFWYDRTFSVSGGLEWKVARNTSLSFDFDHLKKTMISNHIQLREVTRENNKAWFGDSVWGIGDRQVAQRLAETNPRGAIPQYRRNNSYYLSLEHRFSPSLLLRVNAGLSKRNYQSRRTDGPAAWLYDLSTATAANQVAFNNLLNNTTWVYKDGSKGMWTTTGAAVYAGRATVYQEEINYDERGIQVDLAKLWGGKFKQRSLITFDMHSNKQWNQRWAIKGNDIFASLDQTDSRDWTDPVLINDWKYPDPFNPSYASSLPIPEFGVGNWAVDSAGYYTLHKKFYGGLASHTMSFFKDRLVATGAIRYDQSDYDRLSGGTKNSGSENKWTYTIGLTYKLLDEKIVPYISYGSAFNPTIRVDNGTGGIVGNPYTEGLDIGVKGLLLNNKIAYRLELYELYQDNDPQTNPDYDSSMPGQGIPQYLSNGRKKGRGVSFSFEGNLTRRLKVSGNVGFSKAWWDKTGSTTGDRYLLGKTVVNSGPRKRAALALSYDLSDLVFKGLEAGMAIRYSDKYAFSIPTSVAQENSRSTLYVDSYLQYDLFLQYRLQMVKGRNNLFVSVRVKNVLDQLRLTPFMYAPEGRTWSVSMRLTY